MIHVPMQDRGQAQLWNMVQLDAQRATGQFQMTRDFDQRAERYAFQRNRVPAPQRVDVDPMAEIGSDHAKAGKPAFGSLRLQNDRQSGPPPEIQIVLLHDYSLLLSSGSRI